MPMDWSLNMTKTAGLCAFSEAQTPVETVLPQGIDRELHLKLKSHQNLPGPVLNKEGGQGTAPPARSYQAWGLATFLKVVCPLCSDSELTVPVNFYSIYFRVDKISSPKEKNREKNS